VCLLIHCVGLGAVSVILSHHRSALLQLTITAKPCSEFIHQARFAPGLNFGEPHAAKIGTGSVAFLLGSEGAKNIAIATLPDGRIIKRFRFDASSVYSITATPDGRRLYFSDGQEVYTIGTDEDDGAKPVPVTKGASLAIDPAGKYLYIVRTRAVPRPLVRIPLAGGPAEILAIPPQYTLTGSPLSPAAVDASGRILVEVESLDSWFYLVGMIDPSRKTFTLIPTGFAGDLFGPGWTSDGRIAATGLRISSSLWRYKPMHGQPK
jgi:hypothetical protein